MNKEEFLDTTRTDWWLVDPDSDAEVTELRVKLGEAFGYIGEQDWYTKPERLEPLWEVIERQSDLAAQLDSAQGPNDHKAWLETAIETKEAQTPAQTASNANPAGPAETAAQEPAQQAKPEVQKQGLFGGKDAAPTTPNDEKAAAHRSPFGNKSGSSGPVPNVDVGELKSSISDLLADAEVTLDAASFDQAAADPQFQAKLAAAKAALNAEVESDVEEDEEDDDGWDWSAIDDDEDDEDEATARQ